MGLNRFLRFHALCTFCLIIAGGLVTSNRYGLAVPDWPKSYGMWMPPMVGGVFYEHGHRMIGAFVGLLTIALVALVWVKEPRKWVRVLGLIALPVVITQGVLGGMTVRYLLPTWLSTLHATLAQSFFSLIISLVVFTSKWWKDYSDQPVDSPPRLPLLCTVAVFIQLVLGSWMRHSKAGLAIPTFPLSFGHVVPDFTSADIAIHFAHRCWAFVVFLLVATNLLVTLRRYRKTPIGAPAVVLFGLVCVQLVFGAYTVWTQTAVPVATAHVGTGALILATSIVQTVWAVRMTGWTGEARVPSLRVAPKTV